jgi:hypothetical protein
MRYIEREPTAALSGCIDKLWCLSDAPCHARERIVPSGTLELVINLHEDEIRIYGDVDSAHCRRLSGAIVSGAYDRFFVIDTREHAAVIGVHFKPGGAGPFIGVPAGALANTHVDLEALWGRAARHLVLRVLLSGPGGSGSRPMPDGRHQEAGGWNRIVIFIDELESRIERLRTAGTRFRNEIEVGPGGKQILIEDPDGNPVELHELPSRKGR